jgi:hypothetical protein
MPKPNLHDAFAMDHLFKDDWTNGMTTLFRAYNSTTKCREQIDGCVATLMDISISEKWGTTKKHSWTDIQQFLYTTPLGSVDNLATRKLLLIESIMHIITAKNVKEHNIKVDTPKKRKEIKQQQREEGGGWFEDEAAMNAYIEKQNDEELNDFDTRRNTGVGFKIQTEEDAQKLRSGIIQMGFDNLINMTKPASSPTSITPRHRYVPAHTRDANTDYTPPLATPATGPTPSAGALGQWCSRGKGAKSAHENITKSIHAALVKLADKK